MNKKGQGMSLNTVVRVILLGALLVLLIIMIPRAIRRVYKGVETAEEVSMAQLEELKRLAEEKKEEHVEEVVEVRGYLVEAANFISKRGIYYEYKGSKVGGGTNIDYDKAVEKYIEHYKKCEETKKGPGCLTDEAIKFRILNALKEKFFVSKKTSSYEKFPNIHNIVKREEFNPTVILIKVAIYLTGNDNDLENAKKYLDSYGKNYFGKEGEFELDLTYYSVLSGYYNAKMYKEAYPYCQDLVSSFDDFKDFVNGQLRGFEYQDPNKPFLKAMDFKFIKTPYDNVKQICTKIS